MTKICSNYWLVRLYLSYVQRLFNSILFPYTDMIGQPLGIMQACCDTAFDYAHQRKQFGQRIGQLSLD